MNIGEKIYTLRKSMGISQEELAQRLGVTRQAVSKWELGTAQPELSSVAALARVFGVTTDYLLGTEEPTPQQEAASAAPARSYPEWIDHLPGFLSRLLRRYGWLAGVRIAVGGGMFCLLGLVGKAMVNAMTSSFSSSVDQMFSGFGGFGGFGGFDSFYNSTVNSMQQMVANNPVTMICNLMLGIGAVLVLAGVLIALALRRWGRKNP